jgi:hypothetical protein
LQNRIKADSYGSTDDTGNITVYLGDQTTADSDIKAASGLDIAYKKVCYVKFKDTFVGDNVSSLPTYSFVVQKHH